MTEPTDKQLSTGPARDRVIRSMTDDGAFRVMTISSTQTVRDCIAAQDVRGLPAAQLGELLTAAVLVRETMAPSLRVQILLRDDQGGLIVGDSFPEGRTRGLVRVQDEVLGVATNSKGGSVQVMRSLPGRAPHQGIVSSDQPGGITDAIGIYFQQSEQVETFVGIGCIVEEDRVVAAGGYVIQLLPELTDPPLAAMRKRLEEFGSVDSVLVAHDDAEWLTERLLAGTEFTRLGEDSVEFACGCGPEKAIRALAVLGKEEIEEMLADGKPIRVTCDYCREVFEAGPDEIRRILDADA